MQSIGSIQRSYQRVKKTTYIRVCADYRPQKQQPYRIRCTVGGNLIEYTGPRHTPNADIPLFKLFINNTLSTPGARFIDVDLSDFYLMSTMKEKEYAYIPITSIPPDIIEYYNLHEIVDDRGRVLVEIVKGMYGLPQAGRIAYDQLVKHLATAGYVRAGKTPGLFKHITRSTQFILVVDDFGIKFNQKPTYNIS